MTIPRAWTYRFEVGGRQIELPEGEVTVGRSRTCAVMLNDLSVSRNHALVLVRPGRMVVKDLDSSNGTYLNGIRLAAEAEVADGDRLTIGETDVLVRIDAPAGPDATPRSDEPEEARETSEPVAESAKRAVAATVRQDTGQVPTEPMRDPLLPMSSAPLASSPGKVPAATASGGGGAEKLRSVGGLSAAAGRNSQAASGEPIERRPAAAADEGGEGGVWGRLLGFFRR